MEQIEGSLDFTSLFHYSCGVEMFIQGDNRWKKNKTDREQGCFLFVLVDLRVYFAFFYGVIVNVESLLGRSKTSGFCRELKDKSINIFFDKAQSMFLDILF